MNKELKQPEWCNYPNAAQPMQGCWLLLKGDIKCKKDCLKPIKCKLLKKES